MITEGKLYLNLRFSRYQPQWTNSIDQNLLLPLASEFGIYLLRGAIPHKGCGESHRRSEVFM